MNSLTSGALVGVSGSGALVIEVVCVSFSSLKNNFFFLTWTVLKFFIECVKIFFLFYVLLY